MSLVLNRKTNESWLAAALRVGREYDMEIEVSESFDRHRAQGDEPADAAYSACQDWDLLTFIPHD